MAVLVFILSFALFIAGVVSAYTSLDLVPTSPGLVYAFAGAVSVVGAVVAFALGVLSGRVDRLTRTLRQAAAAAPSAAAAAGLPATSAAFPLDLAAGDTLEAVEPEPGPEAEPEGDDAEPGVETAAEAQYPATEAGDETAETEEPLNENR